MDQTVVKVGAIMACVVMLLVGSSVSVKADGPRITSVQFDESHYHEGETVVMTIYADQGTYPIDHYFVLCHIHGQELVDGEYDEDSISFRVPTSGMIECDVIAYDIYCNPSPRYEVTVRVDRVHQTSDTGDDDGSDETWIGDLLCGIMILTILVLVSFALLAVIGKRKKKQYCTGCGQELQSSWKACPSCGQPR